MSRSFQVLSPCPNCKIDAVLVETYDDAIVQSIPISKKCSFCGYEEEMLQVISQGGTWGSPLAALHDLETWAKSEGSDNVDLFCTSNLGGLSAQEVAERLYKKQEIPSSFDVLAFLFPGMAGGGISVTIDSEPQPLGDPLDTEERNAYSPPTHEDIPVVARALAAVMLADGQVLEVERRVLDDLLQQFGDAPLLDSDLQQWLPVDLPIPKDPEALVRAMLEVAFADGELDETEWRVIREFARYWGCDRKKLEAEKEKREAPKQSAATRIWRAIQTLLFTENP